MSDTPIPDATVARAYARELLYALEGLDQPEHAEARNARLRHIVLTTERLNSALARAGLLRPGAALARRVPT